MKIIVAGFNVDSNLLADVKRVASRISELAKTEPSNMNEIYELAKWIAEREFTPETISAAYARISRREESVDELRKEAVKEVEKARRSNENIIYEMGHKSVAEHAVFNIDVIGVSRLFVNFLEKHRLCSYTEKSMRYVLFSDDFFIPSEINQSAFKDEYTELLKEQFLLYKKAFDALLKIAVEKNPELDINKKSDRGKLEGIAKEDARYILPLATYTQLGMTANARNLEYIIAQAVSHELEEVREFGRLLLEQAKPIAPSLIKYTDPRNYYKNRKERIRLVMDKLPPFKCGEFDKKVSLVQYTVNGDSAITNAILFSSGENREHMGNPPLTKKIIKEVLKDIALHDQVPREFEMADLVYKVVMSEACYAQFKRHRMLTLLRQDYSAELGFTIPEAIDEIGLKKEYERLIEKSFELFRKVKTKLEYVAPYILPLATNMAVLVKLNLRELYHISRIREDKAAQWEIRRTANEMCRLARKEFPITTLLLGGKHQFKEIYDRLYSEK